MTPKARHAVLDIKREAEPGQLAITDNIHPRLGLFLQHIIEVVCDLFFKRGFIHRFPGFSIDQHLKKSFSARQTANMRGEHTIGAVVHVNPPSSITSVGIQK